MVKTTTRVRKMESGKKMEKRDPFIKKAALALQHLRKSGRVWVKNDDEMWSSIPFNEFSWLQRFPEVTQKEILELAGPASSGLVGIREPDGEAAA